MSINLLIKFILTVGIGSLIGWITNYFAIKLLFRPQEKIKILFFEIQGLLPKRKNEIGYSIAKIIQEELVSTNDLLESLDKEELENLMREKVDSLLDKNIETKIKESFPMMAMFLTKDMMNKIKRNISDSIMENKDEILTLFLTYFEDNVNMEKIIVDKINGFSMDKLEEVTYSLARKEFKHIEVIGGILGGIIGIVQFGIGLLF